MAIVDTVGWVATAVFASSYFFQRPDMLRGVQMLGATMWIVYGVLLAAPPVIVANVLLIAVAAWTVYRSRRGAKDEPAGSVG